MHNDVFDRFASPIDTTTQSMVFDYSSSHQRSCRVFVSDTAGEGTADIAGFIFRQRAGVEFRGSHHEHFDWVGIARLMRDMMMVMMAPVVSPVVLAVVMRNLMTTSMF